MQRHSGRHYHYAQGGHPGGRPCAGAELPGWGRPVRGRGGATSLLVKVVKVVMEVAGCFHARIAPVVSAPAPPCV